MNEPKNSEAQFILASSSITRCKILTDAGYVVKVLTPNINEREARLSSSLALDSPSSIAEKLAKEKALRISSVYPKQTILAADQVLTCDGSLLSKPINESIAYEQLSYLSGKKHVLHTAVCLISPNVEIWTYIDNSYLTMRYLSPEFINKYLRLVGPTALNSAGCYQLERQGSQLFDRIEGDFFAILGLPLIPTMKQLRINKIVPV